MIRYAFAESNTGRSRVHFLYKGGALKDVAICNPMLKMDLKNVFVGDVSALLIENVCKGCLKKYLEKKG